MNTIPRRTATLAGLAACILLAVGAANTSDRGYTHPCTEDEYVDIAGDCVHVDEIVERADQ